MMRIYRLLAQINIVPGDLEIPQAGTPGSTQVDQVLQIVFGLAGAIAMIVIIIAGIQFILSQGDPQKASTARSAIIYAAVGLVISMLAFGIVRYVVGAV